MFTGLIQDIGHIRSLRSEGESLHIQIQTVLAPQLAVGDSLAINGACLTVNKIDGDCVTIDAVAETLSRTNLSRLHVGTLVNCELALKMSDRLGGHWVQGHIDGLGTIVEKVQRGDSIEMELEPPQELMRYIVEKGSITLDGVSLTVAHLSARSLIVALVPHTLNATTLRDKSVGEMINIEVDILAKYVERLLGKSESESAGGLTEAYLREKGF